MLDKLVSDLVGRSVSGAAACFATGDEETTTAAGAVEADGVFAIASVTKTFVAAAALRLAGNGVLGLDEPAARWCDLAPADVTVRMLLDHTSRIPDYVAAPGVIEAHQREPARAWDPRELVRLATGREPEWRYSNTNYVLLGLVLESVTSIDPALRRLALWRRLGSSRLRGERIRGGDRRTGRRSLPRRVHSGGARRERLACLGRERVADLLLPGGRALDCPACFAPKQSRRSPTPATTPHDCRRAST